VVLFGTFIVARLNVTELPSATVVAEGVNVYEANDVGYLLFGTKSYLNNITIDWIDNLDIMSNNFTDMDFLVIKTDDQGNF